LQPKGAAALAPLREMSNVTAAKTELERASKLQPDNRLYQQNLRCLERRMQDCELSF
jgi:hypothetical protein